MRAAGQVAGQFLGPKAYEQAQDNGTIMGTEEDEGNNEAS